MGGTNGTNGTTNHVLLGNVVEREPSVALALAQGMAKTNPSEYGLIAQGMEHVEAREALLLDAQRGAMQDARRTSEVLLQTIEAQQKTIANLVSMHSSVTQTQLEAIKQRDEASRENASRTFDQERARVRDARIDKMGGLLFKTLALALVRRFGIETPAAAAPTAPAATSPAAAKSPATPAPVNDTAPALSMEQCASVVDFVTSLDEETFVKLVGVLTEEQGAKLMELAASLQPKKDGSS